MLSAAAGSYTFTGLDVTLLYSSSTGTDFEIVFRSAPRYAATMRSGPRYTADDRSAPRYGATRRD